MASPQGEGFVEIWYKKTKVQKNGCRMGRVNAEGGYPTAYELYAKGELNPLCAVFQAVSLRN